MPSGGVVVRNPSRPELIPATGMAAPCSRRAPSSRGAVAAVADHEGALGLGADAFAEQLPLRETESRDPFRLGRELPIDRDLEPVGPCGVENPAHLVGRGVVCGREKVGSSSAEFRKIN